jgi:predicted RNase H-like nuclease (RuvC/YqgF family)
MVGFYVNQLRDDADQHWQQTPVRSPRKSLGTTPAQVTFRDMSPLTDISEDGDENASLKAQLREQEKEIQELRNQMLTFQRSARSHPSRHDTLVNPVW